MKKRLLAWIVAAAMLLCVGLPALAETSSTTSETTETTETEDGVTITTTVTVTVTVTSGEDAPAEEPEAPAEEPAEEPSEETPAEETPAEEPEASDAETPVEDVLILFTADMRCKIDDGIGLVGLSLLKQGFSDVGKQVLLADCGDAAFEDYDFYSNGAWTVDLMNAVGYDVAAVSAQSFRYGAAKFADNAERASFPYVCANLVDADGALALGAYRMFTIGGQKIAMIGVCAPDAVEVESYGFGADETGESLYALVQSAVDAARADGAERVILLSRLNADGLYSDAAVIANTTGIDAVLAGPADGDAATLPNKDGQDVLLARTDANLASVGCLSVAPDGTLTVLHLDAATLQLGQLLGLMQNDGGAAEAIAAVTARRDKKLAEAAEAAEAEAPEENPAGETPEDETPADPIESGEPPADNAEASGEDGEDGEDGSNDDNATDPVQTSASFSL